jgi:nucleoside-diphosphate kinase
MPTETTLVLLKPDAVRRGLIAELIGRFERRGFRIRGLKQLVLAKAVAEEHYAEHAARPFFGELVDFMISGPVVVQVLEGENAIASYRDLMGVTDPAKAAPGTIRKVHATSIGENSVHGSDAPDTAAKEIAQFFSGNEIVG